MNEQKVRYRGESCQGLGFGVRWKGERLDLLDGMNCTVVDAFEGDGIVVLRPDNWPSGLSVAVFRSHVET